MKSTLLTERQKRCLTRAWSRRPARLEKKFANRHAYLKQRVGDLEERTKANAGYIRRLRGCLLGRVDELRFDGGKDGGDLGGGHAADGLGSGESGEETQESPAQTARLYSQTVLVLDVLEEEKLRDLVMLEHITLALKALADARGPLSSPAGTEAADKVWRSRPWKTRHLFV